MPAHREDEIFVCGGDGPTLCPDCIPATLRARLGDDDVETWRFYSSGWITPVICDECKLSIPVYIDGDESYWGGPR